MFLVLDPGCDCRRVRGIMCVCLTRRMGTQIVMSTSSKYSVI